MNDRDRKIIEVRPLIDFKNQEQPLDNFQAILRQILKLQNAALLKIVSNYLEKNDKNFQNFYNAKQTEIIEQSLKKDNSFKKLLIGMIIGLLSVDELDFYIQNEKEINKRIIEFIFKRVCDQLIITL